MPLNVTCPHCFSRFQVSEKFAGKEGPCPKCKGKIQIPKLEDQIEVHAPEDFAAGGKDTKGAPILKPIAREQTKVQPTLLWGIAGATLAVFALAFVCRLAFGAGQTHVAVMAIGLIAVSLPLVLGGYSVLRDAELEPYRGQALLVRASICAAVYAGLWAGFMFLPATMQLWQWAIYAAPFLIIGTLVALATLDLDATNAFFLYAFYLTVTILLRLALGLPALKGTAVMG